MLEKIWEKFKAALMGGKSFIVVSLILIVLAPFIGWNLFWAVCALRSALLYKASSGATRSIHGGMAVVLLAFLALNLVSKLFG